MANTESTTRPVAAGRPERRSRGWLLLLVGVLAGGGGVIGALQAGVLPGSLVPGAAASAGAAEAGKPRYHCPMHPTYTSDRQGDCPICGMKLVPITDDKAGGGGGHAHGGEASAASAAGEDTEPWQCPEHPTYTAPEPGVCIIDGQALVPVPGSAAAEVQGLATVAIDPQRQQLIGLRTAQVVEGAVGRAWRTTGRVVVDETRVRKVNVKVEGFVEALRVDFVGRPVQRGEVLLELYSPELVSAQNELLLALRTEQALAAAALGGEGAGGGGVGTSGSALGGGLADTARQKLRLWDVPKGVIDRIARTGRVQKNLTVTSPIAGVVTAKTVVQGSRLAPGDTPFEITDLSRVWVLADVYASEIGQVRVGTAATLTLQGQPGRSWQGEVAFVDPLMDEKTRTVRVRLAFANPDGELRPGSFGELALRTGDRQGLLVPADAVLDSGTEKVVFLARADGHFEPRKVETAPAPGDQVEVTFGLQAGDQVVTRAAFLVDSESRLKAALAALAGGK